MQTNNTTLEDLNPEICAQNPPEDGELQEDYIARILAATEEALNFRKVWSDEANAWILVPKDSVAIIK